MKEIVKELHKRKLSKDKLISYGFIKNSNNLIYECMLDGDLKLEVIYDNTLKRRVIDINTNDEYVIIDLNNSLGLYAGNIKDMVDNKIKDIINNCSDKEDYMYEQTKDIFNYIYKTYKEELEHPWGDENGVIRHKDNKKWYIALLYVDKSKLTNEEGLAEVIDIKTDNINIVDNKTIFNGYHMNKKSWITIILDSRLDNEIIYSLIDNSYNLTK